MTDNQAAQSYFPGLAIDLRILGNSSTAPDSIIRVHVTSVFAPFTKSQVMRITFPSELGSGFPENAVLKLYDRRYIDDRREQVWSPSREIAARAAWREKRWDGVEIIEGDFSHDWDEFDETKWEEFFRQLMQRRFHNESEVYRRLCHLQGTSIPRCYASVQVMPPPADSQVPEAFVYGLILEDVGGVDISEVDPSTGDYTCLGHSLMAAVHTFPTYGVLHRDIRSPNILISSPTRIVIIDFGHAAIRREDASDDEWNERIKTQDEVHALRLILHHRQIRAMTPVNSRYWSPGYLSPNDLRKYSEEWKRRWYDEMPPIARATGPPWLEEAWRLKDDIGTWLNSRPPPPQCFLMPRPGTPESHVPNWERSNGQRSR